jgi:ATP-dependent RNA helicase DDX55/SPB4
VRKRTWERANTEGQKVAEPDEHVVDAEVEAIGDDTEDWKEMAREEKMAKKTRKGALTQDEFDADFGDL